MVIGSGRIFIPLPSADCATRTPVARSLKQPRSGRLDGLHSDASLPAQRSLSAPGRNDERGLLVGLCGQTVGSPFDIVRCPRTETPSSHTSANPASNRLGAPI